MSVPDRGRFEGSRRGMLLVATEKACRLYGGPVDRMVRAGLALHVMVRLQQGVFDPDELASTAAECLAANPNFLAREEKRDRLKVLYSEIEECFADIRDSIQRMPVYS